MRSPLQPESSDPAGGGMRALYVPVHDIGNSFERRVIPQVGWLSRLFFAFANSLVSNGAKKHLEQQDLCDTAFQVGLSTLTSAPHA